MRGQFVVFGFFPIISSVDVIGCTTVLSTKNILLRYDPKTKGQQFFPPSFKGTIKSSNIKAATQTQFETCVTAF